ncbi:Endo/exonuclease/phosphatase domain-containing protein [Aphelenchoides besseyi]|nr:Endo/exonuclease/phosphatase domain-containing protein [Aphelenchoides besseyi]
MNHHFNRAFLFVSLLLIVDIVNAAPRIDNRTPGKQTDWWDEKIDLKNVNVPSFGILKMMTMNTWVTGSKVKNGVQKIADQITKINPDVIAIQELSQRQNLDTLMQVLKPQWQVASTKADGAIISRHPIVQSATYKAGTGTRILINGTTPIHVYSMHLAYLSYGPYLSFNRLVTNVSVFDVGESYGSWSRYNNMVTLLNDHTNKHFGWVYKWPATYLLQSKAGMVDSYREKFPDPVANPGITWSTVQTAYTSEWNYSIPEPQDRIDFIFYRSPMLKVRDSRVYADQYVPQPAKPDDNIWPTDHFAVISDFERSRELDQKISFKNAERFRRFTFCCLASRRAFLGCRFSATRQLNIETLRNKFPIQSRTRFR